MRKVLVLVLAVLMVLAMAPTVAMAANPESEVKATVDSSYTIKIPAKVDFGSLTKGQTKTRSFVIEAKNVVLEPGERIDVTVESDFELSAGAAKLPYQLLKDNGETPATSGQVYCSFTTSGNYSGKAVVDGANITTAGVYSDVMVFKIGLNRQIENVTGQDLRIEPGKQASASGYFFELVFLNDHKVGDYKYLKLTTYWEDKPVATAILRDISKHKNATRLTCSFYLEDHISSSWYLTKLPHRNCSKAVLEVVDEKGTTYQCINEKVPYRES
mgnify:CR=1 FL=1